MKIFSRKKGFTLIELIVVIAIVGFLILVAVTSFRSAQAKARDAKRVADLKELQKALELYYDKNNTYPTTGSYGESVAVGTCTGGWDCSYVNQDGDNNGSFIEALKAPGILSEVPLDPTNNDIRYYRYYYYGGTGPTGGCEKPFYVLQAFGLETTMEAAVNDYSCFTSYRANNSVFTIVGGRK